MPHDLRDGATTNEKKTAVPNNVERHGETTMSKSTDPPLLMNPQEAARLLGFSARTLEKWRADGSGPVFIRQSSRAIRYRPSDLAAWIEQRARTSTADSTTRDD